MNHPKSVSVALYQSRKACQEYLHSHRNPLAMRRLRLRKPGLGVHTSDWPVDAEGLETARTLARNVAWL